MMRPRTSSRASPGRRTDSRRGSLCTPPRRRSRAASRPTGARSSRSTRTPASTGRATTTSDGWRCGSRCLASTSRCTSRLSWSSICGRWLCGSGGPFGDRRTAHIYCHRPPAPCPGKPRSTRPAASGPRWRSSGRKATVFGAQCTDGCHLAALDARRLPCTRGPRAVPSRGTGVVRAAVPRRTDRGPGRGLAGDRRRAAHADLRSHRLGQDARRLPRRHRRPLPRPRGRRIDRGRHPGGVPEPAEGPGRRRPHQPRRAPRRDRRGGPGARLRTGAHHRRRADRRLHLVASGR